MLKTPARLSRQRGVSLIELMVGLVVSLLIIAAAAATYLTTARSGRDAINSAKLNVELRSAMDLMVDEIRRAGYSAVGGGTNPFNSLVTATYTDLTVTGGTCVEFAYDNDGDGFVDTDEFFGFRVVNGVMQMRDRTAGGGVIAACANGTWLPITDGSVVTIGQRGSTPYFVLSYQCLNSRTDQTNAARCVAGVPTYDDAVTAGTKVDLIETRTVAINLAGQLVSDAVMRMELGQDVLVRNHRIVTVP